MAGNRGEDGLRAHRREPEASRHYMNASRIVRQFVTHSGDSELTQTVR